jgi:hypothetical protein
MVGKWPGVRSSDAAVARDEGPPAPAQGDSV